MSRTAGWHPNQRGVSGVSRAHADYYARDVTAQKEQGVPAKQRMEDVTIAHGAQPPGDWPMIPGTAGSPGRPGYAIPSLQKYDGPKPEYNPYEGARPEYQEYTGPRTSHEQYEEPTSVRDQRTEAQIWDMVRRQGSMRYDPQLQAIQREHPRMQRQAQEAMGAQGLAGSGLAMREATIPLAQQTQRMMGDVRAEQGMFEQTAFDEQTLRERDRTDRMMGEHFNRWMQEQELGMARVDQTFNQWLGEQGLERQFAADDFNRWLGENQHMLNVTGQQYQQFASERAYEMQHAQAAAAARGTAGSGGTPARPATMGEYTQMMQDEAMFNAFQDPNIRSQWAENKLGVGGSEGDPYAIANLMLRGGEDWDTVQHHVPGYEAPKGTVKSAENEPGWFANQWETKIAEPWRNRNW